MVPRKTADSATWQWNVREKRLQMNGWKQSMTRLIRHWNSKIKQNLRIVKKNPLVCFRKRFTMKEMDKQEENTWNLISL